MPNYSILVDIRDRMTPQQTYVPEENIEIISNVKVSVGSRCESYTRDFSMNRCNSC